MLFLPSIHVHSPPIVFFLLHFTPGACFQFQSLKPKYKKEAILCFVNCKNLQLSGEKEPYIFSLFAPLTTTIIRAAVETTYWVPVVCLTVGVLNVHSDEAEPLKSWELPALGTNIKGLQDRAFQRGLFGRTELSCGDWCLENKENGTEQNFKISKDIAHGRNKYYFVKIWF